MIGEYQKAVGAVMEKLTKEELDEASHGSREKRPPIYQSLCREYDTKGKLMAGMHDFNDELGDGMAFPEWESIQDKWSTYATDVFDTKEMVDCEEINEGVGRNRRVQKGKKRPSVPLPTLEDGTLQIPNILDIHAPEKDIMRSFASGKVTASVPWMSIREDPKGYIESKYFPVGVSFKEPTKLTHAQITKILEFWHKRQWSKPQDIFRFRWWKDSKGTLQMPVLENKSWSEKILGKRQQKGQYWLLDGK
ncbi:hypothetical protein V8B97DRAFT_2024189 [Scleroderma yunnanense]